MNNLPHQYKQEVVTEKGYDFSILVETGTYYGDMVWAQRNSFSQIHSIELSPELFKKAKRRFVDIKNVHLYQGDSSEILKELVPGLPPALFWLDAHFSGGVTVKGKKVTPILEELEIILSSGVSHGILIDDARCFGKNRGFPTLKQLERIIGEFQLKNDIIWKRLH